MSKWNRDLGFQQPGNVTAALEATIPTRPTDQELENAPPEPIKNRAGDYLPGHYRDLEARRLAHDDVDQETKGIAVAMAEAGVAKAGGKAHVHVAGAVRMDADQSSSTYGDELMVTVVTITKVVSRVNKA